MYLQSFTGRLCDSFLIFAIKHRLWVHVRTASKVLTSTNNQYFALKHRLLVHDRTVSHRGGSNEYQQSMF